VEGEGPWDCLSEVDYRDNSEGMRVTWFQEKNGERAPSRGSQEEVGGAARRNLVTTDWYKSVFWGHGGITTKPAKTLGKLKTRAYHEGEATREKSPSDIVLGPEVTRAP